MSMIKGIHHVSLKCRDDGEYEQTVSFYRDVLGLPVLRTWKEGTMLETGSGIIEIFNNGSDAPGQGVIRHFAFATDDVDACIDRVKKAGYEVTVEPKDVMMSSEPPFPIRVAFCKGPLGEEIEFFQER